MSLIRVNPCFKEKPCGAEMFVSVDNIEYHVLFKEASHSTESVVMLHGFGGSSEVFNEISDTLLVEGISTVLIDLPGHGLTKCEANPRIFDIQSQVYHLLELFEKLNLDSPWLYGYSMGGRIALRLAVETGISLNGLILESAQLGIENESDRMQRVQTDQELAKKLRVDPTSFFKSWNRLPLFSSGSIEKNEATIRFESIQQSQNPDLLALSLEYMSPGLTPVFYPSQLAELPYPVLVFTGELDKKYDTMWVRISSEYSRIDHLRIARAGHRIHLDQPELLAKELIHYIKSKHKSH